MSKCKKDVHICKSFIIIEKTVALTTASHIIMVFSLSNNAKATMQVSQLRDIFERLSVKTDQYAPTLILAQKKEMVLP